MQRELGKQTELLSYKHRLLLQRKAKTILKHEENLSMLQIQCITFRQNTAEKIKALKLLDKEDV